MIYRLIQETTTKESLAFQPLWMNTYFEYYGEPIDPFDGCNKIATYRSKTWYPSLLEQAKSFEIQIDDEHVTEACVAPQSAGFDTLVFIVPGASQEQSRIFHFRQWYTGGVKQDWHDVKPADYQWQLQPATRIDDNLGLFKAKAFGKRNEDIIPVEGDTTEGDCHTTVRSEYNVRKNTVNVTQVSKQCGTNVSRLCTDPATTTEMGSVMYPIDPRYAQLGFLGQLFTAADCGSSRLQETFGGENASYSLGSAIWLKDQTSPSLTSLLQSIGFACSPDEGCKKWELYKTVKIKELLKLEPYTSSFKQDDCRNCG